MNGNMFTEPLPRNDRGISAYLAVIAWKWLYTAYLYNQRNNMETLVDPVELLLTAASMFSVLLERHVTVNEFIEQKYFRYIKVIRKLL
jgi:hypothetical protein